MAWTILIDEGFEKDLKKLDKSIQKRILGFLTNRLAKLNHPRELGKPLSGVLGDLWRYRVGDYRIVCKLKEKELIVLVLRTSHRKAIYKKIILRMT